MVEIITAIDKQQASVVYVIADNDGCTISTVDFIQFEIDSDVLDKAILHNGTYTEIFDELEAYGDLHLLVEDAWLSYIKSICKHTGRHMYVDLDVLPMVLKELLTPQYIKWLIDKEQLVETDGYTVFKNSYCKLHSHLLADVMPQYEQAARDMVEHLDEQMRLAQESDSAMADFNDSEFTFGFRGLTIKHPCGPEAYDGLRLLLTEWLNNYFE